MKVLLMTSALLATLAAGPASAEMYLGGGVGDARTNSSETSWKVFGGFQFDPTWGIEAAYTDLGGYRGANVQARSLAITGTKPLSERWSLLGKLGASSNRAEFAGASDRTDVLLGVGVGYAFTKNVGVRLEYEDFGKLSKSGAGNDSRGSNLGLSVKYAF